MGFYKNFYNDVIMNSTEVLEGSQKEVDRNSTRALLCILKNSIGILNGFYKEICKDSLRILLKRDSNRSLWGNTWVPIGILQGFPKGILKGNYEELIRILLRVLWRFHGNFYRDSMMNPMKGCYMDSTQDPMDIYESYRGVQKALEGIPQGF